MKPYPTYLKEAIEELDELLSGFATGGDKQRIKRFLSSFADRLLQGFEEAVMVEERPKRSKTISLRERLVVEGWNLARAEMIRRMEEFKKV